MDMGFLQAGNVPALHGVIAAVINKDVNVSGMLGFPLSILSGWVLTANLLLCSSPTGGFLIMGLQHLSWGKRLVWAWQ